MPQAAQAAHPTPKWIHFLRPSTEATEEARHRESLAEALERRSVVDEAIHEAIHYSQKSIEEPKQQNPSSTLLEVPRYLNHS